MEEKRKIGLFGFGTVGEGTYQILKENPWLPLQLAAICIKDPGKKRSRGQEHFTSCKEDLLEDKSVSLIVEAISEADEAFIIVKEALLAGKDVVTANKKMVCEHLEELLELQAQTGRILRYGAAVCGAIPVLDVLDTYFAHEPLEEVSGIVNGSTNYILSRMQDDKLSYEEALRLAQELGFAEADPALDVSGQDARNKLVITALHAFGEVLRPDEVIIRGIDALPDFTAELAKRADKRIKLVARLHRREGKLYGTVLPELLGADHPLYSVTQENNRVLVQGKYSGLQQLSGKGAGALPTGTAVMADIRAVLAGNAYQYTKYKENVMHAV